MAFSEVNVIPRPYTTFVALPGDTYQRKPLPGKREFQMERAISHGHPPRGLKKLQLCCLFQFLVLLGRR